MLADQQFQQEVQQLHHRRVYTILLAGMGVMLLFMRTLIRKNRQLRQEMSHREQLENQLSTNHQQFRNLVENLQAIAWEMDPQSLTFTYVSPHARRVMALLQNTGLNRISGDSTCTQAM